MPADRSQAMMKAVIANTSPAHYALTLGARYLPAGVGKRAGWWPGGIVSYTENEPVPQRPERDGWVRIRTELSTVCGSDIKMAQAKMSVALSALYTAERQVLGHEMVGVVDEVGPGVTGLCEGDRVVCDIVYACEQRGLDPCRLCATGYPNLCENVAEPVASGCIGPTVGFMSGLGGGMSEYVVAHQNQLHKVGTMPSKRAVISEPAGIAVRAASHWDGVGDRAVVIGPGPIGLLTTAALRQAHPNLHISVLSPHDFGSKWARKVGANRVLSPGKAAMHQIVDEDGGGLLKGRFTKYPMMSKGVDLVIDCVGASDTIDLGVHLLRPRGTFVLTGTAATQKMDWSLVWKREIRLTGTTDAGAMSELGGKHTTDIALEYLSDKNFPVDGVVERILDVSQYAEAFTLASNGPAEELLKVALRSNYDVPLVG